MKVVLLHGANGGSVEIEPLRAALASYFEVAVPDWLGHGGRPLPADLDVRALAADFVAWMDARGIERAWVAGYSVGGYLALCLARLFPERVEGVVALAAKALFDSRTLQHWTYLVSIGRLEGTERARQLAQTHAPNDWRDVARLNHRFFESLGKAPPLDEQELRAIACPVMLANGHVDPLVPWEETAWMGGVIPRSRLVKFYGGAHPIGVVPVFALARALDQWARELEGGASA